MLFRSVCRSHRSPCAASTIRGSESRTWSLDAFPHPFLFPCWSYSSGAQTSPALLCVRQRAGTQVDTELATWYAFHSMCKHVPSDFPPWPIGVDAEEKLSPLSQNFRFWKMFKYLEKVELFNELFYNFKSHLSFSIFFPETGNWSYLVLSSITSYFSLLFYFIRPLSWLYSGNRFFFFYIFLLFNYSCPHFSPITLPWPTHPPPPTFSPYPHIVFVHESFLHAPWLDPSPSFLHYTPLPSPLVTVSFSLFPCLWFYFGHLFVLSIRFHLKVRSYGICPSPPGLFHLA